jgi:hypothetical protein
MTTSAKKFLVLYLAPAAVLADWARTDPSVKKAAEEKMRKDWNDWTRDHAKIIRVTEEDQSGDRDWSQRHEERHHVVLDRRGRES